MLSCKRKFPDEEGTKVRGLVDYIHTYKCKRKFPDEEGTKA